MEKERNIAFDLLKGLGILLMMGCHLSNAHPQWVYSFHMPLFFLVAGYYAKINTPPPKGYSHWLRDLKRLVFPFVMTMILLCGWGLLQTILKDDWSLFWRHVLSLFWAGGDAIMSEHVGLVYAGPMWFLLALFWMREVFYYGAGWIAGNIKRWADEIILGVCVVISIGDMLIHPLVKPLPWSALQGLASLQFYVIGWYTHRHQIPWWVKLLCILCWPCALFWGGMDLSACSYTCYPLDTLGACGAVLVLYYIFDWITKKMMKTWPKLYAEYQTPLQWLGVNSLAVLCMHTLEMHSGFLFSILCQLPFDITGGWLVVLRITVAIGMAWVVMKIPILRSIYGKN